MIHASPPSQSPPFSGVFLLHLVKVLSSARTKQAMQTAPLALKSLVDVVVRHATAASTGAGPSDASLSDDQLLQLRTLLTELK